MSHAAISLAGVFPPITTPFDADGEVHYQALEEDCIYYQTEQYAGQRDKDDPSIWQERNRTPPESKKSNYGCDQAKNDSQDQGFKLVDQYHISSPGIGAGVIYPNLPSI